ncbi:MAG: hypothetical protein IJM59_02195 [Proteobacteria bacterium]|nr:hypothetical protein [Pseudomonadota bacterium]
MMNTKQILFSALAISICATIGKPAISFAQAPENIDKSLAPIVMILIDTSTSMAAKFGSDGHNRLTKAQAEIAGAPKTDNTNSSNGKISIISSTIYLPRTYPECTSTGCTSETRYVPVSYQTAKLIKQNNKYPDSLENAQSYDFANAYYGNGIIQSYMYSVKFGFGAMNAYSKDNYKYGKGVKTNRSIFPKGYGITINAPNSYKYGLYDGDYDESNPAPTLYPTVSDDMMDMYQSNSHIINSVRSYWMDSSTPIGGCLADYYFMFSTPDPALTHQYVKNTNEVTVLPNKTEPGTYDDYFACRPKAVLVITDGAPNAGAGCSGKDCYANGSQVWWDAARLYSKLGVRVYAIAYAQTSISIDTTDNNLTKTGVGNVMNKIAWKGGTCRDPDTQEIISPTDDDAYKNFIKKAKSVSSMPQTTVLCARRWSQPCPICSIPSFPKRGLPRPRPSV